MKLKRSHLFYILLLCLLFGSLGFTIKESFTVREGLEDRTSGGQIPRLSSRQRGNPDDRARDDAGGAGDNVPAAANAAGDQPLTGAGGKFNQGIDRSQIPSGSEDLYVLKSAIVPPVCPKCPDINLSECNKKKCPPCPPCGRCPEAAFKCKKVPDYRSTNTSYLPQPILTDFSKFSV